MSHESKEPNKTIVQHGNCDPHDRFHHEAFGMITVVETSSSKQDTLFGSDIGHSNCLSISISTAVLDRDLSRDTIHQREQIITIDMSHAQFAQFITSKGSGCGTPVTLRYLNGRDIPSIKNIETKAQVMEREIYESSKRQLAQLDDLVKKFGSMLETGKVGLKEARELHRSMSIVSGNLPSNMEFVVQQGRATINSAQSAAMIELEAFGSMVARRLGTLEQLTHHEDEASTRIERPKT